MEVSWADLHAAINANADRGARLPEPAGALASIAALPAETDVEWLAGFTEDTTFTISDAVSFVLWALDPMYRASSGAREMEMEKASALIDTSETAWKARNGRVRGWVRKHLEEDLRLRAGGGDPAGDFWSQVRTKKRAALLLDYACIMAGVRVAIWWPEDKAVTVLPISGLPGSAPLVQINGNTGHALIGTAGHTMESSTWPAVYTGRKNEQIKWVSPMSTPAIGSHTTTEIQEQLRETLGSSVMPTGNRAALWNHLWWARLAEALT
jgi:hypothetical protein